MDKRHADLDKDAFIRAMGIALVDFAPGRATMTMTVREDMLNAHAVGHGATTFALADAAFGFACNAGGVKALALSCAISYTAPTRVGDVLTAEAVVAARAGRTGLYDVTVRRGDGEIVALMRGQSYRIGTRNQGSKSDE